MIYIYRVYKNNDSKEVSFLYTRKIRGRGMNNANLEFSKKAIKKINRANNNVRIQAGAVIDPKTYKILSNPLYGTDKRIDDYEKKGTMIPMYDGTLINLYEFNGDTYLGTSNSWDISDISDMTKKSYGEYFYDTCDVVNYETDNLDLKSHPYTIMFCNPEIHFMTKKHMIIDFINRMCHIEDGSFSFDDIEVDADNFISITKSCICFCNTTEYDKLNRMLYFNRKRFKSDTHEEAVKKLYDSFPEGQSIELLNDNFKNIVDC